MMFGTLQEVLELTETIVHLQDTVDKEKLDNNPFFFLIFCFHFSVFKKLINLPYSLLKQFGWLVS